MKTATLVIDNIDDDYYTFKITKNADVIGYQNDEILKVLKSDFDHNKNLNPNFLGKTGKESSLINQCFKNITFTFTDEYNTEKNLKIINADVYCLYIDRYNARDKPGDNRCVLKVNTKSGEERRPSCHKDSTLSAASTEYGFGNLNSNNSNSKRSNVKRSNSRAPRRSRSSPRRSSSSPKKSRSTPRRSSSSPRRSRSRATPIRSRSNLNNN